MKKIEGIQNKINEILIEENRIKELKHISSGKLSASMLYQPLRFQVLKTIGVERKAFDAYTLGKFKRGAEVENWHVSKLAQMGVLVYDFEKYNLEMTEGQPLAKYRDAVGYVDSVISLLDFGYDLIVPNEIKSVTNAKLKRIQKIGVDTHYQMQACFYAMAMKVDNYAVTIVSAEDLRSETFVFKTKNYSNLIDVRIDEYNKAIEDWNSKKVIPEFKPRDEAKWTTNPTYSMFDEWYMSASSQEIKEKIENSNK